MASTDSPDNPRRRGSTRSLMAAVIVLTLAGIAATAWVTIREFQVQRTVFTGILDQKLESTRDQFRYFLGPFDHHLAAMDHWLQSGTLDPGDHEQLSRLLIPLVDPDQQFSSVYVIPAEGPAFQMVRNRGEWVSTTVTEADSVFRGLPWYVEAAEVPEHRLWSEYHTLPGLHVPGLVMARSRAGIVFGLGLLESDLDYFSASAPITENGILIRRFDNGTITWMTPLMENNLSITSSNDLLVSDLPQHVVIGRALQEWGRKGQPYQESLNFRAEGRTWWAVFYPAIEGTDPGELGLIAPEEDLSRRLETVTGRVTILFGVVLFLAMAAVVVLAFDYRKKWRRIAKRKLRAPADEAELVRWIEKGESDQVEFKATMRWNLKADRAGKEMEIAWLKSVAAFLNTEGGFIFLGVRDDGTVGGIEPDKFRNEDRYQLHFDNLIKQHLGLQFAPFIHAAFHSVDDRRILVVRCDRCPEPVYLRSGEDETFYIRVGPSSRPMPASQIHEYVRERGI